jgi:hypothetical protein
MNEERPPAPVYMAGQGEPVPRHRRNPRRAYDRDGREIRPMDLANAASHGVTMLRAFCRRHAGTTGLCRSTAFRRRQLSAISGCACAAPPAGGRAPRPNRYGRGGIEPRRRPDP